MNRAILLVLFSAILNSVTGKEKAVYLVQGADLIDLITGNIPKGSNVTLTKVTDLEKSPPDGLYFEPEDDLEGSYLQFVKTTTKPEAEVQKPVATTIITNKGKRFATRT